MRGLRLMQNGRTWFVPYSQQTIAFWNGHNQMARTLRDGRAQAETVTIEEATQEEVRKYLIAEQTSPQYVSAPAASAQPSLVDTALLLQRIADLEARLSAQPGEKKKTKSDKTVTTGAAAAVDDEFEDFK